MNVTTAVDAMTVLGIQDFQNSGKSMVTKLIASNAKK